MEGEEELTQEVEWPGKPVASRAGNEWTMDDVPVAGKTIVDGGAVADLETGPVPPDAADEEHFATVPVELNKRPDVLFGPVGAVAPPPVPPPWGVPGPDEATGPQPVVGEFFAPAGGFTPVDARPASPRRRWPLLTLVIVVGLGLIAAVAFALMPEEKSKTVPQAKPVATTPGRVPAVSVSPTASAPSTAPTPSAPAAAAPTASAAPTAPVLPSQAVLSGNTANGVGVTYQTVEVSPGYFEGSFVFTNNTGRPLDSWSVSFTYPGANITNVWGGELDRSGQSTVIRNDSNTAPVAAGASVTVRFGGSGQPSRPMSCQMAGQPCGF